MPPLNRQVELSGDPCVSLRLDSRPETLTLVRAMLGAVAELLVFDPELVDDLKTAVSEACNNVVLHAYPGQPPGLLSVELYVLERSLVTLIGDRGVGIGDHAQPSDQLGVGIPVIRALAEYAEFSPRSGGGTEVLMSFAGVREGHRLFEPLTAPLPPDGWATELQGDAVGSISPVDLLGTVLGRLARALAATAEFSLDRFSDLYLLTDALAAHVRSAAITNRMAFALEARGRRMELSIGPLSPGSGEKIRADAEQEARSSPLALLSDQLHVDSLPGNGELLRVVMLDHATK